jgi:hypothetical protein
MRRPLSSIVGPALLAVGQVVVPLVGWVAGIVVIATSRAWLPREKFLLLVAPLVGLTALGIGALEQSQTLPAARGVAYGGPSTNDFFPSAPLLGSAVLPVLIANAIVAIVLVTIAIRRSRTREGI